MSYLSALKWVKEDISLLEFCDQGESVLPCIMQVNNGFYGVDDHKISSEEMFFVYGFKRQRRVVAKDKKGSVYSFPIDYKKVKFQICPNGAVNHASKGILLESIVKEWNLDLSKRFIMVEDNKSVTCSRDVTNQEESVLGVLQLVEVFDLKFILGHAMCADISTKTTAIPDFMDITVCRAIGACYTDQPQYLKWFEQLSSLVATFNHDQYNMDGDIILFDTYDYKNNSSSHYEYIRFHQLKAPKQGKKENNKITNSGPYEGLNKQQNEVESIYDKIDDFKITKITPRFEIEKVTRDFPFALPKNRNECFKLRRRLLIEVPEPPCSEIPRGRKARVPTPVSDVEEQYCSDGDGGDNDDDNSKDCGGRDDVSDDDCEYSTTTTPRTVIVNGDCTQYINESIVGGVRVNNIVEINKGNVTNTVTCTHEKKMKKAAYINLESLTGGTKLSKPRMPPPRRKK